MHLTLDVYVLVLCRLLPAETLLEIGHRHLLAMCPVCRSEFEADAAAVEQEGLPEPPSAFWAQLGVAPAASVPVSLLPEDDRVLGGEDLERRLAAWDEVLYLRDRARRHLRHLLEEPPEDWPECVEGSRSRYRSRAFAELLVEESRERVRHDPRTAQQLAALVPVVIRWIAGAEGKPWAESILIRAAAWEANALRVAGDLKAADQIFAQASPAVSDVKLDSWTRADVASLEASLRIDQRRFGEAEELLDAAAILFRKSGDTAASARIEVQRGNLLYARDRTRAALHAYQEAAIHLREVAVGGNTYLHYTVLNGRIAALVDLDRYGEAKALLEREAPFFLDGPDRHVEGLIHHLRSRIALGLGDSGAAEAALTAARDAYLETGRTYDAVIASLDLAQVHLEAGRLDELEALVVQLVPQFEARGVARETLASLSLLAKAAAARNVTRDLVTRLRERIGTGHTLR